MGRWKTGDDGLYWDEADSGPDQGTPTPEQLAAQQQSSTSTQPSTIDGQPSQGWSTTVPTDWSKYATDISSSLDPNHQIDQQPANNWIYDESHLADTQPASTVKAPTTPTYQQMEGVDMNKMNDASHTSDKYTASRILASGGSIQDAAAAIGAQVISPTKMRLTRGEGAGAIIDIRRDEEGANALQWLVEGGSGGGSTGASGGGISSLLSRLAGGAAGAGGSMGSGAAGASMGMFGDKAQTLWDMLMGRAGQSLVPGSKDPLIANQVNAFSAQNQRAGRDYIDDLAESRGPISNLQGEKRLMAEKQGQAVGGFQATLMQRETDARRQEIQQALNGAMGFLNERDRMALQRELEYLSMGQRAFEFDENNEFRRSPLGS